MTMLELLEESPIIAAIKSWEAIYFCGVLISAIPVLVVFACFQDTFMSSLSMGGLKG